MNRSRASVVAAFAFLVVLVFASVVPASAQTPRPTPRARGAAVARLRGPFRPILLQLRGLQLTPDQRQQVLAVFKAHQPDIKALRERLVAARQAAQGAPLAPEARKGFVQERQQLLQGVRKEVVALLTPEQRQKLEARRAKRQR